MIAQDAVLMWKAFLVAWMALGASAAFLWAVAGLVKWIRRR